MWICLCRTWKIYYLKNNILQTYITEWTVLRNFLGGEYIAGGALKEAGTAHWVTPNTGATNESGFTALPGGYRSNISGEFFSIGYQGNWWSPTGSGAGANNWKMDYQNSDLILSFANSKLGFSVRCLKD